VCSRAGVVKFGVDVGEVSEGLLVPAQKRQSSKRLWASTRRALSMRSTILLHQPEGATIAGRSGCSDAMSGGRVQGMGESDDWGHPVQAYLHRTRINVENSPDCQQSLVNTDKKKIEYTRYITGHRHGIFRYIPEI
jgi:hypothetical protein